MHRYFKLDGKIAMECRSLLEWAEWMEIADRHVAKETIEGFRVSTVFLGLNHNFSGNGDPLLFETMVFSPNGRSIDMKRYFTWEEAEEGHKKIVETIKVNLAEAHGKTSEVIHKIKSGS